MSQQPVSSDDLAPASSTDFAIFRHAIETAPDAVFWINEEARFVYVNERACASLGYTREELSSLHVWDIDPSVDRKRWRELWGQASAGSTMETHHQRKDGMLFPVEVSAKDLEIGRTRVRVAFARDTTARNAVTDALRRTQFAVDRAREAIFWVKADASLAYVNDAACESLGYTREELLSMTVLDFDPGLSRENWGDRWRGCREARSLVVEATHQSKSGRKFPVEIASSFMQFEGAEYNCAYARDISERRRADEERARLESQLLHAQKLESVGRLAGGVAHDFNNMLSVILGYAELIARSSRPGDLVLERVEEIRKAATRSRDTTRQLLAFSRKQMIAPRPVDLNQLVADAKNALLRLIGEDVDLRFVPAHPLSKVLFDPSQIEQMLINLVVNARDALASAGAIVLETSNVRLDEAYCRDHVEASPGEYVVLSVSDNGVGMDRDTLSHIFEPFFTTKEVGKGTGLGLATVYGMIKQNGGFINVYSEPGLGSTFKIYIPAIQAEAAEVGVSPEAPAARGRETVLVVEDDEMVRNLTKSMLEALDYTVLVAATPSVALSLCERPEVRIDLLISDVVMPQMQGPELSDKMRAMRPDLNVLFISGYTSDVVVHGGVIGEGENFVQKPFTLGDLARSARNAMRTRA